MSHPFSDLSAFRRDPLQFFLARGNASRERMERLRLGPAPIYLVVDPTLVKPIMKAAPAAIDKGKLIHKLRQIVGNSSLTISGEEHARRRKAIHGQMAKGVASSYVAEISALYRRTFAHLLREGSFDAHAVAAPLALRVVCTVLFGPGVLGPVEEGTLIRAVHLVEDDLADGMFRLLPSPRAYFRKRRNLREAKAMMAVVVDRARRNASEGSLVRQLQKLGLSDQDLRDEVLMLILAGHHTTGTAAAWVFWHLANDPALARRIAAEATGVVDESGELMPSRLPSADLSLGFTREILRLYPSAYWFSREAVKTTEIGGVTLRKGTSLLISPWHLHRDPRFWPEPERFDAERSHASPAYVPFGVGPRACVGIGLAMLELQVLVLELASTFELAASTTARALTPKPSVTLIPPPITVRLAERADRRGPDTTLTSPSAKRRCEQAA
ncbi:cytochrome P450 (plasmid) [Aureimonas ureilytica]|uniref:cytochrome P450 n=1 Tax=Aureimonas ureilytica TaxID=401562 RepID=UPI003CF622B4